MYTYHSGLLALYFSWNSSSPLPPFLLGRGLFESQATMPLKRRYASMPSKITRALGLRVLAWAQTRCQKTSCTLRALEIGVYARNQGQVNSCLTKSPGLNSCANTQQNSGTT